MDPLSEVLSLLKPRSSMSGGLDLGGAWSIHFPRHEGIKCYSLVSGRCWLAVDGVPEPVRLTGGDCFLLPRGRPFSLTSDLSLTPVDAYTLLQLPSRGAIRTVNGGGDCFGVGGHFTLEGLHVDLLLGMLPPIVHIRKQSERDAMRWSLERMMQELREGEPGSFLVAQHLAHLMLLQALRLYLAEGLRGGVGWLFALADPQMSIAIQCMHDAPAFGWTLQKLAKRAGMSRSSFALKFKQTVGTSPMEYLTRWRMLLAGDRLVCSSEPISAIALSLGYESESAFGQAFKRTMGCSPRQYSRGKGSASFPPVTEPIADAAVLEAVAV